MTGLNWSFVFTIINLIVLYALMKRFLYKPILNIMEQREKLIKEQLDAAKNTEDEALALKEKYEKSMENAKKEADGIMDRSRRLAQEEYDLILQDANTEAKRVMKETGKAIEIEREKTMQGLSDEIAALAVSAAGRAIGDSGNGTFDKQMMKAFLKKEGAYSE